MLKMTSDFESRCSYEHLLLFKDEIDEYLVNKDIWDLSKYEVAIENGEMKYLKWDYNIEKPKDIKGFSKSKKYIDLNIRKLILNIPSGMGKQLYYNVDGESYNIHMKDRYSRFIQTIIQMFIFKNNQWSSLKTDLIFVTTGFLVVDNRVKETEVTGEVHILILYGNNENKKEKKSVVKPTSNYFTFPNNYINSHK